MKRTLFLLIFLIAATMHAQTQDYPYPPGDAGSSGSGGGTSVSWLTETDHYQSVVDPLDSLTSVFKLYKVSPNYNYGRLDLYVTPANVIIGGRARAEYTTGNWIYSHMKNGIVIDGYNNSDHNSGIVIVTHTGGNSKRVDGTIAFAMRNGYPPTYGPTATNFRMTNWKEVASSDHEMIFQWPNASMSFDQRPGVVLTHRTDQNNAVEHFEPQALLDVRGKLYADTIIAPLRVIDTTNYVAGDTIGYYITELVLPRTTTVPDNRGLRAGRIVLEFVCPIAVVSRPFEFDVISDTANGVYMAFAEVRVRGSLINNYDYSAQNTAYFQRYSTAGKDWQTQNIAIGTYAASYCPRAVPRLSDGRVPEGHIPMALQTDNNGGNARVRMEIEFSISASDVDPKVLTSGWSDWWIKLVNM